MDYNYEIVYQCDGESLGSVKISAGFIPRKGEFVKLPKKGLYEVAGVLHKHRDENPQRVHIKLIENDG